MVMDSEILAKPNQLIIALHKVRTTQFIRSKVSFLFYKSECEEKAKPKLCFLVVLILKRISGGDHLHRVRDRDLTLLEKHHEFQRFLLQK